MIVYCQAAILEELKRRIADGVYVDMLPTAAQLAEEFRVNIKTMNKAINQLAAAGQVERRRRTGTVIKFTGEPPSSRMIEAIFSGFTAPFLHPFWGEVLEGALDRFAESGYRLILNHIKADPVTHLFDLDRIQLSEAAGRIVIGPEEKRVLDRIAATNRPMICAGDEISAPEIPSVYFDFTRGIADAVKFLQRLKCRKIGFIGHTTSYINLGALQKFNAYLSAIQSFAQIDPHLTADVWPVVGEGEAALEQMLTRSRPDALIVAYDLLVPEIGRALAGHKLAIPVIGCDGLTLPDPPEKYLTIRAPRRECGQLAAELLIKAIEQPGARIGRHPLPAVFESALG